MKGTKYGIFEAAVLPGQWWGRGGKGMDRRILICSSSYLN
jgi:hypothetical protein